jgi:predicted nucleotidyltransferase
MKTETLWSVEVGSFIWKMNHAGSDHDLFECYIVPTEDILAGRVAPGGCHVTHTKEQDSQRHEIQRWVQETAKGNFNYVTGVLSPIVYSDVGWLAHLRTILLANPSTAIKNSVIGLANSGIAKADKHIEAGDERRAWKNLRTAMRSMRFAEKLVQVNEPHFDPFQFEAGVSLQDAQKIVEKEIAVVESVVAASRYPERPGKEPFERYLLEVRKVYL